MPGVDGVEATRIITTERLADVLVLTSFSDSERIVAALDAGALGYLLKDADPEEVLAGIRAVSRGSRRSTLARLTAAGCPVRPGGLPRVRT